MRKLLQKGNSSSSVEDEDEFFSDHSINISVKLDQLGLYLNGQLN